MATDLLRRVLAVLPCPLYQVYGITWAGHVGFGRQTSRKPGALRPTGHCGLRAIRPGGLPDETVPVGEPGELIAGTGADVVFSAYINRPRATAAAITRDWYRAAWPGLALRQPVTSLALLAYQLPSGRSIQPGQ